MWRWFLKKEKKDTWNTGRTLEEIKNKGMYVATTADSFMEFCEIREDPAKRIAAAFFNNSGEWVVRTLEELKVLLPDIPEAILEKAIYVATHNLFAY